LIVVDWSLVDGFACVAPALPAMSVTLMKQANAAAIEVSSALRNSCQSLTPPFRLGLPTRFPRHIDEVVT
jgi:hypothetical protein